MEAPTTSLDHQVSAEERHRIERVARDMDGDLAETLWRLLKIMRNGRLWGFLAQDHPLHPYYLQQKVSEQCRILRPRPAGVADAASSRPPHRRCATDGTSLCHGQENSP